MKFFKINFRGKVEKEKRIKLFEEAIKEIKALNINLSDRNFDLLDEMSKLKDNDFKLKEEYNETIKLLELREKNNKELENKITGIKNILGEFKKIETRLDSIEQLLDEFKGNVYEIKRVKSCSGSKQKLQVKSNLKNSSIIKKVVGQK